MSRDFRKQMEEEEEKRLNSDLLKAIQEQERISLMLMKKQKDDKKEELGPQFKFMKRSQAALEKDHPKEEKDHGATKR